jgi:hypothetical protein
MIKTRVAHSSRAFRLEWGVANVWIVAAWIVAVVVAFQATNNTARVEFAVALAYRPRRTTFL